MRSARGQFGNSGVCIKMQMLQFVLLWLTHKSLARVVAEGHHEAVQPLQQSLFIVQQHQQDQQQPAEQQHLNNANSELFNAAQQGAQVREPHLPPNLLQFFLQPSSEAAIQSPLQVKPIAQLPQLFYAADNSVPQTANPNSTAASSSSSSNAVDSMTQQLQYEFVYEPVQPAEPGVVAHVPALPNPQTQFYYKINVAESPHATQVYQRNNDQPGSLDDYVSDQQQPQQQQLELPTLPTQQQVLEYQQQVAVQPQQSKSQHQQEQRNQLQTAYQQHIAQQNSPATYYQPAPLSEQLNYQAHYQQLQSQKLQQFLQIYQQLTGQQQQPPQQQQTHNQPGSLANLANTGPHTFPSTREPNSHSPHTSYPQAINAVSYAHNDVLSARTRSLQSSTYALNRLEAPFKPSPFVGYTQERQPPAAAQLTQSATALRHSPPLHIHHSRPIHETQSEYFVAAPVPASGQQGALVPIVYMSPTNAYDLFRTKQ